MKVVVAPNSFKGSLSASEAAAAIAKGVRAAIPDADVIEIPVADGGEGTVDALVSSRKGTYKDVEVEGPLSDPVRATYGLIDGGRTGVVQLARIESSGFDAGWRAVRVMVACDVTNPLTGPEGASYVYGPQKGADPDAVRELDQALANFAGVIERDLGKQVADIPGAGAAGGAGAGLVAFLDARLVKGAPLVVEASGFDEALQ